VASCVWTRPWSSSCPPLPLWHTCGQGLPTHEVRTGNGTPAGPPRPGWSAKASRGRRPVSPNRPPACVTGSFGAAPPTRARRLAMAGAGVRWPPSCPPPPPSTDALWAHTDSPVAAALAVDGIQRNWLLPPRRHARGRAAGGTLEDASLPLPGGLSAAGLRQAFGMTSEVWLPGRRAERRSYHVVRRGEGGG